VILQWVGLCALEQKKINFIHYLFPRAVRENTVKREINSVATLLEQRRAGILLHITSLPGDCGQGDMGKAAYHFIKFLYDAGITVWQTLPLGFTHNDGSPYQCLSAHAGNPALINLAKLKEQGWLSETEPSPTAENVSKKHLLTKAFQGFQALASKKQQQDFKQFCQDKAFWLEDFSLFMALRTEQGSGGWHLWPKALKKRQANALKEAKQRLQRFIEVIKFEQYIFFTQWLELKAFAAKHHVLLLGDIPIFVAYDSVDVWVNRKVFKLNNLGEMSVVAGVPPDYFAKTGQRWGNPHYDWKHLQQTQFEWWIQRLSTQLELFDIVRIDHFRGLEAAWEISASEKTAINGTWVKAPGTELLAAIKQHFGTIPLIAEDLGVITDEVNKLRCDFNLPGMKILQFAFDGSADNLYLPHNYEINSVVYTGTHDNDTTLGWYEPLTDQHKKQIYQRLGSPNQAMPWALIQAAFASVANLAIIPLQDILELGTEARMNIPGTMEGNWQWQFSWDQLTEKKANYLAHLVKLFGR
jgi:4-alpha-glucanotransferase